MRILNLGCGSKTSSSEDIINIDWSIYLRVRTNFIFRIFSPIAIRGERRRRYNEVPDNIYVYNLSKGIPFESGSVDVVYHSHMLEHLDRCIADTFLKEIKRVLKPGGIQRIVVPDLEIACKSYIAHISKCEKDPIQAERHDDYVAEIIEQSVRREASGTSEQSPIRRAIENLILGDARRRGETHQWMYDRINLANKLLKLGYTDIVIQSYDTSYIPNWDLYGLDTNVDGTEYKSNSMYIEARNAPPDV